ncbi:hypothetical protein EWM64_g1574 [Hericium alpestre]|uniref:Uncharacterized protein n=1 Tax=Hericium alpestre TaxID=135208 RepID=A0A4Z0A941_9AGAM|nr:hypothetical protein EWM64_g1574 [Hericium alpestre]
MVHMASMSDLLSTAAMIKVDDDEDDVEDQHTIVVNGWQAIEMLSSPATPSLGDGSSEIDELLLESPEPRHVPINKLAQLKLDEVVMPRSTSIGGIREKPPYLGDGNSLFDFVSPFIQRFDEPSIVTSPKSQLCSPQMAALSLLGEPPTVVDGQRSQRSTSPKWPDSSDDLLQDLRLLHGIVTVDPLDLIAREQLVDDENDNIGLMEVTRPPEPTEHGPNPFMPNIMSDLIAPQVAPKRASAAQNQVFSFMKKVKGAKDLTLQLSWRPFKFDDIVPTDVELAQVASLAEPDVVDDSFAHLQELLATDESAHDIDLEEQRMLHYMTRSPFQIPKNLTQNLLDSLCDTRMILTRNERRRSAKLRGDELSEPSASSDELLGAQSDDDALEREDRDNKRMKLGGTESRSPDPNAECSTAVSHKSGLCVAAMKPLDPHDAYDFDDAEMVPIAWAPSYVQAAAVVDEEHLAMHSPGYPLSLEDYLDDNAPADTFVPLSLDSQISYPAFSQIARSNHVTPGRDYLDDSMSTLPDSSVPNYTNVSLSVPPPSPKVRRRELWRPQDSDLLGRYLALRSEKLWTGSPEPSPTIPSLEDLSVEAPQETSEDPYGIPEQLIDHNTLTSPDTGPRPFSIHTYLASVEMIQKRSLIRHLSSRDCSVRLVERETRGGADLILDPDTAVVYFSLFSLPSQSGELQLRLEALSWCFRHICIIFGTYPASQDLSVDSTDGLAPCPFSPPIIKAVKKFKRDLGIAEAFNSKSAESTIYFAFALSVEEAARYARLFGDKAEQLSELQVWDDRQWLGEEELEDEKNLAIAEGMNTFTAAAILHHVSLDDFLAMTPDQRLEFGCLVGEQRIAILNDAISRRSEVIHDVSFELPE